MQAELLAADDVEKQKIRSQDLQPAWFDAGMFYFYRTETFLKERTTLFPNTLGYAIDESECQDIDTPEDWKMAEMKYTVSDNTLYLVGSCEGEQRFLLKADYI